MIVDRYKRWLLLSWILVFRNVCQPLRKKFPDLMSLQLAGILKPQERLILEDKKYNTTGRPLVVIDCEYIVTPFYYVVSYKNG